MPQALILGNGGLTALWDERGRIRKLYYPGPGDENHLQDGGIRFGIWVDGKCSWLHELGASPTVDFNPSTGIGMWRFDVGFELKCTCQIDDTNSSLWISFMSTGEAAANAKLFVSSRFNIGESDIGQTALYVEESNEIVHFKDGLAFVIGGGPESPVAEFACGIAGFGDSEGTWRDAEDGHLSGHPIAQGSVDSTIEFRLVADEPVQIYIQAVERPFTPKPYFQYRPKPKFVVRESSSEVSEAFVGLPPRIANLCRQSVAIMQSHLHNGAVPIAALDRDVMATNRAHYAHCWMRDAAQIVDLFLDLGDPAPARGYLDFCASVINPDLPAYLQKYTSSGSLASTWHPWLSGQLPIQLDETAWVVKLAARMLQLGHITPDFAIDTILAPSALWIASYVDESGLPLPSWDLWEERCDVAANSVCVAISALSDASIALESHEPSVASTLAGSAEKMKVAFLEQMIDHDSKAIRRRLSSDSTVDASILAVVHLGIVSPDDPIAIASIRVVRERLLIRDGIGGVARYEGDYYYRLYEDYPGNPWVICTMWFAQALIKNAKRSTELEEPLRWLDWAVDRANGAGVLAEQFDPTSGVPLAVAPLAWSHSEFVKTSLRYLESERRLQA